MSAHQHAPSEHRPRKLLLTECGNGGWLVTPETCKTNCTHFQSENAALSDDFDLIMYLADELKVEVTATPIAELALEKGRQNA